MRTQSPTVISQVLPVPHSASLVHGAPAVQQPLVSHTSPVTQSASLTQPHAPLGTQTPVALSQVPLAQSASLAQGGTPVTQVWVLGSHIWPTPQSEDVVHRVAGPSTTTLGPQAAHARASGIVRAKEMDRRIVGASGKGKKGGAGRQAATKGAGRKMSAGDRSSPASHDGSRSPHHA